MGGTVVITGLELWQAGSQLELSWVVRCDQVPILIPELRTLNGATIDIGRTERQITRSSRTAGLASNAFLVSICAALTKRPHQPRWALLFEGLNCMEI